VKQNHAVEMVVGDELVDEVVKRCQEPESGARNVDRILTHTLLPSLSTEFLKRMMSNEPMTRATVTMEDSGEFGIVIE
jgi:type VI secretion system protein VasG